MDPYILSSFALYILSWPVLIISCREKPHVLIAITGHPLPFSFVLQSEDLSHSTNLMHHVGRVSTLNAVFLRALYFLEKIRHVNRRYPDTPGKTG